MIKTHCDYANDDGDDGDDDDAGDDGDNDDGDHMSSMSLTGCALWRRLFLISMAARIF